MRCIIMTVHVYTYMYRCAFDPPMHHDRYMYVYMYVDHVHHV